MNRDVLEAAGIDVDEALNRMMGNESLLARLLPKFTEDTSLASIDEAVARRDADAAAAASHTLKGIAGNLSIKPVHALAGRQCDLFRAGAWDDAVALTPQLSEAVAAANDAIRAAF